MGEAFGAAVTRVNGRDACALFDGAKLPHPARRYAARSKAWKHSFICNEAEAGRIRVELGVCRDVRDRSSVTVGSSVRNSMVRC